MSHKRSISLLQENESAPSVKKSRFNGGCLSAEDWLDLESILDENFYHSSNMTIPEVTPLSSSRDASSNVTLKDSLMDLLVTGCDEAEAELNNNSNFNSSIKSPAMTPPLLGKSAAVLVSDDDDESEAGAENVLSYQRPASPAVQSLENTNVIPCDDPV